MSRVRYEITATLDVLSPLHVGSGGTRPLERKQAAGANEPAPEVAAIARDGEGKPYLPSTSMKGVIRREAEGLFPPIGAENESDEVRTLFGAIRKGSGATADEGQKGLVNFRGASASNLPSVSHAPYGGTVGAGVFVIARTAIDPATGTAADHRLFFREAVAPGAQFPFRADIEVRGANADARAKAALDLLLAVLARLTVDEGVGFGASQADGDGRMRLDPATVQVSRRSLGADGAFEAAPVDVAMPAPAAKVLQTQIEAFQLHCPGPFLVVDSSRLRKSREDETGNRDSETPHIQPQTLDGDQPFIGGAGLSGALRSRAGWLQQLIDGPADNERELCVDPAKLSPVQRLFGVTGFRGLVTLRAIKVSGAKKWNVMSVKLDRFSGAPMDEQLFKTMAYVGTQLSFQLELSARTASMALKEEDLELFNRLCDDIRRNGLELGHGTSKGFGWFEAPEATR